MKGRLGREGGKEGSSAGQSGNARQSESEGVQVAVGEDMRKLAWLVHAVHHLPASSSPLGSVDFTMMMST